MRRRVPTCRINVTHSTLSAHAWPVRQVRGLCTPFLHVFTVGATTSEYGNLTTHNVSHIEKQYFIDLYQAPCQK